MREILLLHLQSPRQEFSVNGRKPNLHRSTSNRLASLPLVVVSQVGESRRGALARHLLSSLFLYMVLVLYG
jgi:hypothetical protein